MMLGLESGDGTGWSLGLRAYPFWGEGLKGCWLKAWVGAEGSNGKGRAPNVGLDWVLYLLTWVSSALGLGGHRRGMGKVL